MSRTFRRTNRKPPRWVTHDWEYTHYSWARSSRIPKEGKDLAKAIAVFHSDAGVGDNWMEPGPAWYRLVTKQIPLRRDSAKQLRRFLLGEDIEIIIDSKPPLEYWS